MISQEDKSGKYKFDVLQKFDLYALILLLNNPLFIISFFFVFCASGMLQHNS